MIPQDDRIDTGEIRKVYVHGRMMYIVFSMSNGHGQERVLGPFRITDEKKWIRLLPKGYAPKKKGVPI